jgi:hypothetical protein
MGKPERMSIPPFTKRARGRLPLAENHRKTAEARATLAKILGGKGYVEDRRENPKPPSQVKLILSTQIQNNPPTLALA